MDVECSPARPSKDISELENGDALDMPEKEIEDSVSEEKKKALHERRINQQRKKEEENRKKQEELAEEQRKREERRAKLASQKQKKLEEVKLKKKAEEEKRLEKKKAEREKQKLKAQEQKNQKKLKEKEKAQSKRDAQKKKMLLEKELESRLKLARQMMDLEAKHVGAENGGSGAATPGNSYIDALRRELLREKEVDELNEQKRIEEMASKTMMDEKILERIKKEQEERMVTKHMEREAKVRKVLMEKQLSRFQKEVDKAAKEHSRFQEIVRNTESTLKTTEDRIARIRQDISLGVPAAVTIACTPKAKGDEAKTKIGPRPVAEKCLGIQSEFAGDALFVWDFLRAFNRPLSLTSFSMDDFICALEEQSHSTILLAEAGMVLLRMLLEDQTIQEGVTRAQKSKKTRREADAAFDVFPPSPSPAAINALSWEAAIRVVISGSPLFQDMERAGAFAGTVNSALNKLRSEERFQCLPAGEKLSVLKLACDAVYGVERMTGILQDNMNKKLEVLSRMRADEIEYKKKVRERQQRFRQKAIEALNLQKEEQWKKRKQEAKKQQEAMKNWLTSQPEKQKGEGGEETAPPKESNNDGLKEPIEPESGLPTVNLQEPKQTKGKSKRGKKAQQQDEELGDEMPAFTHTHAEINGMVIHFQELEACESISKAPLQIRAHSDILPEIPKEDDDTVDNSTPEKTEEELESLTRTEKVAYAKKRKHMEYEKQHKERSRKKNLELREQLDEARNLLLKCFKKHDLDELEYAVASCSKNGLEGIDQDGVHWMTQEMKKGYGMLEVMREKEKRIEQVNKFRKEIDDCLIRTECLGEDNQGKKYWRFGSEKRLYVEESSTPSFNLNEEDIDKFLEGFTEQSWTYYEHESQVYALVRSLDKNDQREKKLREALMESYNISEQDADDVCDWRTEGNEFIGRRVKCRFSKKYVYGVISGWLPAEENEGLELWHVNHDDGDEEDFDGNDLKEAIRLMEEEESASATSKGSKNGQPEVISPPAAVRRTVRSSALAAKEAIAACSSADPATLEAPKEPINDEDLPKFRRYVNNLNKNGPRSEEDLGFEALRHQFCSVEAQMTPALRELNCQWVTKRTGRSAWLKTVKEPESGIKELARALIELEEAVHELQKGEDIVGDEEKHIKLEELGWLFDKKSHKFIGQRVRRFFSGEKADGTITAYLPPKARDDIKLWRVEHDDGDEEDLGEDEAKLAMAAFNDDLQEEPVEESDSDEDDGDKVLSFTNNSEEEDSDNERNKSQLDASTLWPTWGYRQQWIRAVEECGSVSVLALALTSLLDVCIEFGAAIDTSQQTKPRQANKWQKMRNAPKKKTKSASKKAKRNK